jgi:ribosomal protein L24E
MRADLQALSTDINWWPLRGPFCKIVVETFISEGRTRGAGILYVYSDVKINRHFRQCHVKCQIGLAREESTNLTSEPGHSILQLAAKNGVKGWKFPSDAIY